MIKTIIIENKKWKEEMRKMCACSHQLMMHGFTLGKFNEQIVELHVSGCVLCDCKEFRNAV